MKYRGVMTIPGTFRVATAVRAANFRLRFLVPALDMECDSRIKWKDRSSDAVNVTGSQQRLF